MRINSKTKMSICGAKLEKDHIHVLRALMVDNIVDTTKLIASYKSAADSGGFHSWRTSAYNTLEALDGNTIINDVPINDSFYEEVISVKNQLSAISIVINGALVSEYDTYRILSTLHRAANRPPAPTASVITDFSSAHYHHLVRQMVEMIGDKMPDFSYPDDDEPIPD